MDGRKSEKDFKKFFVATLINIDRLVSARHVPFMAISPVKPRTTGASSSTIIAGRRSFRVSTRHVPWCCTFSFSSRGALVCYAAEQLNLSCDEQQLGRLFGIARLLVDMCLANLTRFARAESHKDGAVVYDVETPSYHTHVHVVALV